MPLYLDVHHLGNGVTEGDAAQAHAADLATQDQYGVTYKKYWLNEASGTIFCLVEAPDAEAAARVHKEAHGLVADEIFEVTEHE